MTDRDGLAQLADALRSTLYALTSDLTPDDRKRTLLDLLARVDRLREALGR